MLSPGKIRRRKNTSHVQIFGYCHMEGGIRFDLLGTKGQNREWVVEMVVRFRSNTGKNFLITMESPLTGILCAVGPWICCKSCYF